jgi:hypothetical protein
MKERIFLGGVGYAAADRAPCVEHNSTPFNSLQLCAVGEPDATCSLSLKVSLLTGASSLLEDACMFVPCETVDVSPAHAQDLFPPSFSWAVPS